MKTQIQFATCPSLWTFLVLSVIWILPPSLQAEGQSYYVDDGRAIKRVELRELNDQDIEEWRILLFRAGAVQTPRSEWGMIVGKTVESVTTQLRNSQDFAQSYSRMFGGDPVNEKLTYFNSFGPIAKLKRKVPSEKSGMMAQLFADFAQATRLYREFSRSMSFKNSDKADVLRNYLNNFGDVQKKLFTLRLGVEYGQTFYGSDFEDSVKSLSRGIEELKQFKPPLGTGDVQATLTWTGASDLDLHIVDPNGEQIYYQHQEARSGGRLDADDTRGSGPENIFWHRGAAPEGEYQVFVKLYSGQRAHWKLKLLYGGVTKECEGDISGEGRNSEVFKFSLGSNAKTYTIFNLRTKKYEKTNDTIPSMPAR